MAKPHTYEGKQFRLLPSLLDMSGDPHPHAGEVITIRDRTGKGTYQAETEGGKIIVVHDGDWGPVDVMAALAAAAPAMQEQLQLINLYTDPKLNVIEMANLDDIDDSPFQPRTHYPEPLIDGMAASMKAVGMLQAMLCRRKADGRLENVFGHCRKRSGRRAGLVQGPVIIRQLTDAESAQLQAVENLQRQDLDALDEAASFQAYIKAHGCTKDEFCKHTGLSRTLVYNRLKLATLGPEGQKALRDKKIRSEVATLLARVPSEKHQAQALKMIMDNTFAHTGELMTVRKARDMLREKFTLALKGVIWALDDATLVESAGACTVCPKRSGTDPVVYEDLLGDKGTYGPPKGENVCTDPLCFDAKKTAQLKANQAELEAKGKTVISGNKARQALNAHGELKGDNFIALKDVKAELKKIAGKGTAKIETVLIQDQRSGKTVEAVKREDVIAAGVPENAAASGKQAQQAKQAADRQRDEELLAIEVKTYAAVLEQVRTAAKAKARSTLDMQLIAQTTWEGVDWQEKNIMAELYSVERPHILEKQIGSMGPAELSTFMLDCALVANVRPHHMHSSKPEALLTAAKHYGVDVGKVRKSFQPAAAKPAKASKKVAAVTAEDDVDMEHPE